MAEYSMKITKIGNSLGVILNKELLAKMNLSKGDIGSDIVASQADKYLTFLALSMGDLSEEQLAAWIAGKIATA